MLTRAAFRPRRQNAPRPAWKCAEAFKQWIRGRDCAVAGSQCEGRIQAAHVDHAGSKGIGTKVADRHCIPLCEAHHRAQHGRGWRTFETDHRINAVALADAYWRTWPGRSQWEHENA